MGEVEVDESYFGGVQKNGKGRASTNKVAVFGILQRKGKVYTKVISDATSNTLIPIIKRKVIPDSIVYTDSYSSYRTLDVSDFHHLRVNHSQEYVDGNNRRNHINGIENFWSQAKRNLRKYNGITRKNFPLFLKECEFRFNYGSPKEQLTTLKKWIKMFNNKK